MNDSGCDESSLSINGRSHSLRRVLTLIVPFVIATHVVPAVAQTTSSTTQQSASESSGEILQIAGTTAVIFLLVVGIVIVFIWLFPTFFEDMRAFKMRTKALQTVQFNLESMASRGEEVSVNDLERLLRTVDSIGQSPSAKRGITQNVMAFTIVTILGVALFALMLSGAADAADLRKTIITALLGVLATIVGFFFGTQAAESGGSDQTRRPRPTPRPTQGEGEYTPAATELGESPAPAAPPEEDQGLGG